MVIGQSARREQRSEEFKRIFRRNADAALDVMELMELAWHDVFGDIEIPVEVERDVLTVAAGDLGGLVRAARLGITDWRDLRMSASGKQY